MNRKLFGKLNVSTDVYSYTLTNGEISAEIITYGAIIKSFSRVGSYNIVGSFDTLEDYLADKTYQGAIIGRVANRIEDARFTIDGTEYILTRNSGKNCHHGGDGFNSKIWDIEESSNTSLTLSYYSEDGESGFPGGLKVFVTYSLLGSALIIDYKAYPEKKTPIALTSHPYFNLSGLGADIYSHEIAIYADRYSAVNSNLIPTGEHPKVDGTQLDLRSFRSLGEILKSDFSGYDHNFRLSPSEFEEFNGKKLGLAAKAKCNGLLLSVYTDMSDLQFYSVNSVFGPPDFTGAIKRTKHGTFCLEAQTEPNAVNHGQTIYDKGEIYTQTTVYNLEKIKDN